MRARPYPHKKLAAFVIGVCLWNHGVAADADLPEQFANIKEFLLETVSESQSLGAYATQALLQDNLLAFRNLQQQVDKARHLDEIIEELSSELDAIASNFERAASMRRDYGQHTAKSNRLLKEKRGETRNAIDKIEKRIHHTTVELQAAERALPTATALESDRHQVTISANKSVLRSLQTQVEIWLRFEQAQERLVSTLNISTERVDFVLFVLQKNAQVYREAANTAQLRRNVHFALADLHALGDIESSLRDLTNSWRDVDQIVREIGDQDILPNAAS